MATEKTRVAHTSQRFEAVKKLDFVFLALVFSVTYRREKPDFFNFFTASFAVG